MLEVLQKRLYQSLVDYLVEPVSPSPGAFQPMDLREAADRLLPGDIILVLGRTRFSSLVCRLTQSSWSHVAIHAGPHPQGLCIVEADIEKGVRRIGLDALEASSVCVLRHRGMTDAHRLALTAFLDRIVGHPYSVDHALAMCCLLIGGPRLGGVLHRRLQGGHIPAEFICSSLVACALAACGVPLDLPERARGRRPAGSAAVLPHALVVPGDFATLPDLESIFDSRKARQEDATPVQQRRVADAGPVHNFAPPTEPTPASGKDPCSA